jgi:hypothetical protein
MKPMYVRDYQRFLYWLDITWGNPIVALSSGGFVRSNVDASDVPMIMFGAERDVVDV